MLDILTRVYNFNGDFIQLETVEISDEESERLTNLDAGGYMQERWFGELTNPDGLKSSTDGDLCKGKIREFGKELFG